MAGRWVKAAFLVILGIVLLIYSEGVVEDMRNMMESLESVGGDEGGSDIDTTFEWIWDLMTVLLWILVAWLFVLAALTVALSFQEAKYSVQVVLKRLDRIDRKLGIRPARQVHEEMEEDVEEEPKEEARVEPVVEMPAVEEDIPPPPKE